MGKNGGKRPGAGRKKGTKNAATLERDAVMKTYRDRVMRDADRMHQAQTILAFGQTFLYRIDKEWIKTGKGGFWRKKPPVRVTAEHEIASYLERRIVNGDQFEEDDSDGGAAYYFITTKEPDKYTLDSMFDRTFGRAQQHIDHTTNEKDLPTPIM